MLVNAPCTCRPLSSEWSPSSWQRPRRSQSRRRRFGKQPAGSCLHLEHAIRGTVGQSKASASNAASRRFHLVAAFAAMSRLRFGLPGRRGGLDLPFQPHQRPVFTVHVLNNMSYATYCQPQFSSIAESGPPRNASDAVSPHSPVANSSRRKRRAVSQRPAAA